MATGQRDKNSPGPIRRVVFTGGPGAGKTALLDELGRRGYLVVPESAREIIASRKRQGLTPRPVPEAFARQIISRDLQHYRTAVPLHSNIAFFDRSMLDALGSLVKLGLSGRGREQLLSSFPYQQPVFVFPPWPEIYRQDAERDQTYTEAVQVHARVRRWYAECGYDLLEVPPGPIDDRCRFVLRQLGEPEQ